MPRENKNKIIARQACEIWNSKNPIGTKVILPHGSDVPFGWERVENVAKDQIGFAVRRVSACAK